MARRAACVLLAVAATLLSGCVQRRFRVESNPPGAYVTVNNQPYGPAPVDVPFLYYGKYDIELKKEGFQTLRVKEHVRAPWFEYPPADFFAENLYPLEINDFRVFCYEMQPVIVPNLEQFKAEGEGFRQRAADLPPPRFPELPKQPKNPPPPPPPAALPIPKEGPTPPSTFPSTPPG
jgi:hypothetical protein